MPGREACLDLGSADGSAAVYDYIEAGNPDAALALDEALTQRTAQLTAFPLLGRPGRLAGTRELIIQSHQS